MDIKSISIRGGYAGDVKVEAYFIDNGALVKTLIEVEDANAIILQALKDRGYTVDYTAPRQNYRRVIIAK